MRITELLTTLNGEGGFAVLEVDDPALVIAPNPVLFSAAFSATSIPTSGCARVVRYGENLAPIESVG